MGGRDPTSETGLNTGIRLQGHRATVELRQDPLQGAFRTSPGIGIHVVPSTNGQMRAGGRRRSRRVARFRPTEDHRGETTHANGGEGQGITLWIGKMPNPIAGDTLAVPQTRLILGEEIEVDRKTLG
mmetsp:Transcript_10110/g.19450  ORF Transcript_10110/g.19450 Transcript_10110/m.19450 type:complete len:127 (-) Transcript_10110:1126-1506(-)